MKNLVAILRGIKPAEAESIAAVLVEAGFVRIEVPLNSPESPLQSIEKMAQAFGDVAEFGAGTVLSTKDIAPVMDAGGSFIVAPNCNPEVIAATKKAGLYSIPGAITPSECFQALSAGADAIKIFPATLIGFNGLKALREVLPAEVDLLPVGGVDETQFEQWKEVGASGFGMANALYKPGMNPQEISQRAKKIVRRYKEVMGK